MAACAPGVSVAKLALEHGVNTNLLFKWRREYRAGKFGVPIAAHTLTEAVEKPALAMPIARILGSRLRFAELLSAQIVASWSGQPHASPTK